MVLAPEGGAMGKLLPIFKLGAGGVVGSGEQFTSWIHIDDLVCAIKTIAENQFYQGIFNLVSPRMPPIASLPGP